MNSKILRMIFGLAVVAVAVPSCIGIDSHRTSRHHTTIGQELQDLEVAHDKGLINNQEYDRAKSKILHRY